MIERKNKYTRIRVIGGSGIFDSIVNILKKPIVAKLLTSAGKSVASALGERLVSRMLPAAPLVNELARAPQPVVSSVTHTPVVAPMQIPARCPTLPTVANTSAVAPTQINTSRSNELISSGSPSSRAQELISRYTNNPANRGRWIPHESHMLFYVGTI
jgi:hypothetical protein